MPTRVGSLREEAGERLERETGFEPATPSLEGWRSTAELFPRSLPDIVPAPWGLVGRGGFEPPKASASRFTVCPLWPLGYLPACSPNRNPLVLLALAGGFEPPTHCLQGSCSSPELRQQSQNFTVDSTLHEVKAFLELKLAQHPPRAAAPPRSTRRPPPPRRSANPACLSSARSARGRRSGPPAASAPPPRPRARGTEGRTGRRPRGARPRW